MSLILYLKELEHEVKIRVIFSNEIMNCVILSKPVLAGTALWTSTRAGCFREFL